MPGGVCATCMPLQLACVAAQCICAVCRGPSTPQRPLAPASMPETTRQASISALPAASCMHAPAAWREGSPSDATLHCTPACLPACGITAAQPSPWVPAELHDSTAHLAHARMQQEHQQRHKASWCVLLWLLVHTLPLERWGALLLLLLAAKGLSGWGGASACAACSAPARTGARRSRSSASAHAYTLAVARSSAGPAAGSGRGTSRRNKLLCVNGRGHSEQCMRRHADTQVRLRMHACAYSCCHACLPAYAPPVEMAWQGRIPSPAIAWSALLPCSATACSQTHLCSARAPAWCRTASARALQPAPAAPAGAAPTGR